jgi:hypothetical protein
MRRPNPPSDVPKARSLLETGIRLRDWRYVKRALPLLFRAKAVRRARSKHKKITSAQIRETMRIALTEPDTSLHEITNRTGLPNAGRASEIVTGLRR